MRGFSGQIIGSIRESLQGMVVQNIFYGLGLKQEWRRGVHD